MDCKKVGAVIRQLRTERGYTQQQVADALNISNKAVSKWENGLGCPDVSLLGDLSIILGADLEQILNGRLRFSQLNSGNMNKVKFYVCPVCQNVLTDVGSGNISCCGRRLAPLVPQLHLADHDFNRREIDLEYYFTSEHPMVKEHYISFIAYVDTDKMLLQRLYPEQSCAIRVPLSCRRGILFAYCTKDGLWAEPLQ